VSNQVLAQHGGHEEVHEHDIPKQQNMAIWLGLAGLTFFYATFVGSNIYLRGWSPSKFALSQAEVHNLPYYALLDLIAAFITMMIAGALFKQKRWQATNIALAVLGLLVVLYALFQLWIIEMFGGMSAQIWTAYMPSSVIQLLLAIASLIYIAWIGWRSTLRDKSHFMRIFPLGMNIWMYMFMSNVVVYFLTDVVTIGSFVQWCGMHLGIH